MRKVPLAKAAWIPKVFPKKGLFLCSTHAQQKKLALQTDVGRSAVKVDAPQALNLFDMRLYTALLGMALRDFETARGKWLPLEPQSPLGLKLRQDIKVIGHSGILLCAEASLRACAREIGLASSGQCTAYINASLLRLSQCRISIQSTEGSSMESQLLAHAQDDSTSKLLIALNSFASTVIQEAQGYTFFDLEEARKLRHSASSLLHYTLSSIVDRGKSMAFKRKTLEEYLYGQAKLSNEQKKSFHKALQNMQKILSWGIEKDINIKGEELYRVTRPLPFVHK